eukprot:UN05866
MVFAGVHPIRAALYSDQSYSTVYKDIKHIARIITTYLSNEFLSHPIPGSPEYNQLKGAGNFSDFPNTVYAGDVTKVILMYTYCFVYRFELRDLYAIKNNILMVTIICIVLVCYVLWMEMVFVELFMAQKLAERMISNAGLIQIFQMILILLSQMEIIYYSTVRIDMLLNISSLHSQVASLQILLRDNGIICRQKQGYWLKIILV